MMTMNLADPVTETPEIMPCGHPRACLVYTDEGTHHCAWCEDIAWWRELVMKLTADLVRVRMRATVGGASVL